MISCRAVFASFQAELEQRKVGSLNFRRVPGRNEIVKFVTEYDNVIKAEVDDTYKELDAKINEGGGIGITMTKYVDSELVDLPVIDAKAFVKQTYFRSIDVAVRMYHEAHANRPVTIKYAKRVVQNFIDILGHEEKERADLLLLLTEVKNWQGYLVNHAVNTAIYSVGLGMAMGLDRVQLRDLGIAAMLVDIGNAALPSDVLDQSGKLTDEHWDTVTHHPLKGVPLLTRFQEMDTTLIKAVIATLAHHKDYDGDGYPDVVKGRPSLFAQIIAVADRYDAMTTPRPYRRVPMTPPRAIQKLINVSGTELNPLLVKIFIQWMGAIPAGSVVLLENGQLGMVVKPSSRLRGQTEALVKVLRTTQGPGSIGAITDTEELVPVSPDKMSVGTHTLDRAVGGDMEAIERTRTAYLLD